MTLRTITKFKITDLEDKSDDTIFAFKDVNDTIYARIRDIYTFKPSPIYPECKYIFDGVQYVYNETVMHEGELWRILLTPDNIEKLSTETTGMFENTSFDGYRFNGFKTHFITIDDEEYKIFSDNPNKHVYKGDTLSFMFKSQFGENIIDKDSLVIKDKKGNIVQRPSRKISAPVKSNSNGCTVSKGEVVKYNTKKSKHNGTVRHTISVKMDDSSIKKFAITYDNRDHIAKKGSKLSFDYYNHLEYLRIKKHTLKIH